MMEPIPLPAFADNYIWCWQQGEQALVVDPGEASAVIAALDARGLELAAILVTHHHGDHVGGVDALRARLRVPSNRDIRSHRTHCEALRARAQPTLPSTIGLELKINPFLRCEQPEVAAAALAEGAASADPLDVFTALREWKNRFR